MSAFRLAFPLPAVLVLRAPTGRHSVCLSGCTLDVDQHARVTITAPSRLQAFEQARAWLRRIAKDAPAQRIAAELTTPAGYYAGARGGRDTVWIVLNAEISFCFGGIEPAIADAGARRVA